MKKSKITLLLVDDHPLVREGLRSYLAQEKAFEIVGEAVDGAEALRIAKDLLPQIILLDINMPGMNGLETARLLKKTVPKSKILILTMHDTKEYVSRMISTGVQGYVLKDSSPSELIAAIETVQRGETYFSPKVSQTVLNDLVKSTRTKGKKGGAELSRRESEVLTLIAEGFGNKEIAAKLFVSVRTVETHRERIIRKLDIHTVAGLTRYALTKGIVKLG
ncbi:MAG TPA: response regulator transcription factor [Bacteroidota bacterium]|nr:response regulator transcription factor [Bacteroidota bacterium]